MCVEDEKKERETEKGNEQRRREPALSQTSHDLINAIHHIWIIRQQHGSHDQSPSVRAHQQTYACSHPSLSIHPTIFFTRLSFSCRRGSLVPMSNGHWGEVGYSMDRSQVHHRDAPISSFTQKCVSGQPVTLCPVCSSTKTCWFKSFCLVSTWLSAVNLSQPKVVLISSVFVTQLISQIRCCQFARGSLKLTMQTVSFTRSFTRLENKFMVINQANGCCWQQCFYLFHNFNSFPAFF